LASAFTHAFSALALGTLFPKKYHSGYYWFWGMFCAVFPDADVIGFKFGIPYGHVLGHRGLTHSFFFALIFAFIIVAVFFRKHNFFGKGWWIILGYLFVCTASHGVLDAMTTGGKGIAFFAPFENGRYFFPDEFRRLRVSPIGIQHFFGEWGIRVMKSEFLWVWIPCIFVMLSAAFVRLIGGRK